MTGRIVIEDIRPQIDCGQFTAQAGEDAVLVVVNLDPHWEPAHVLHVRSR